MRCLGSAQRLRSKYGKGYQIEIGLEIPSLEEVTGFADQLIQKGAVQINAHTRLRRWRRQRYLGRQRYFDRT